MSENTFNLGTVIDDAKRVITNPIDFYKNLPTSGGYANPLIFVVVMAAITGLIVGLFGLIGLAKVNPMMGTAATLSAIIVLPIFGAIGSFIGAAVMFVIWKLMGSDKNYEAAYRCVAYSFAIGPIIAIISFIPYVAGLIRVLWGSFLMYTASVETHQIKAQTAKIVFGILAALGIIFGFSAERNARNFEHHMEKLGKQVSESSALESLQNIENMTPEEAGEQFGKFMKGLEEFQKGMEKSVQGENQ